MFTLTSRTAPLASVTRRSRRGVNCLQGPHQGAQKSTMTGTSIDASSTSAAKLVREASLIRPEDAATGALPGGGPALAWALSIRPLRGRPAGSMREAMMRLWVELAPSTWVCRAKKPSLARQGLRFFLQGHDQGIVSARPGK